MCVPVSLFMCLCLWVCLGVYMCFLYYNHNYQVKLYHWRYCIMYTLSHHLQYTAWFSLLDNEWESPLQRSFIIVLFRIHHILDVLNYCVFFNRQKLRNINKNMPSKVHPILKENENIFRKLFNFFIGKIYMWLISHLGQKCFNCFDNFMWVNTIINKQGLSGH